MNREIKFRAWDKDKKEMSYFGFTRFEMSRLGMVAVTYDEDYLDNCLEEDNLDKFELMQFTGLHDKNGKEIYEGDVLRQFDYKGKPLGSYVIKPELEKSCGCCSRIYGWEIDKPEKEEIIGNIYETPELLEKAE